MEPLTIALLATGTVLTLRELFYKKGERKWNNKCSVCGFEQATGVGGLHKYEDGKWYCSKHTPTRLKCIH